MTDLPARILGRLIEIGPARTAIAIAVLQFSIVVGVAGHAAQVGPREPFHGTWEELAVPGHDLVSGGIAALERWDGLWYEHIALDGYGADDGTTAFMPLYPMLGRLVAVPLLGDIQLALILESCAAYAAALWLLARLVVLEAGAFEAAASRRAASDGAVDDGAANRDRDPADAPSRLATLTMLALATFPTAFFFVAPFTESSFLALTLGTVLLARRGRLGPAALVGALATLVRIQGVFLALPIAWEALRGADLLPPPRRPTVAQVRRLLPGGVAAAVPVVALGGWYLALSALLGRPAIGMSAQAPWGYQLVPPWQAIATSVDYIAGHLPAPIGISEALNLASLVGFVVLLVVARRLPFSHELYAIPSLALVGARTMWFIPLMSVSRYVLAIYPGFLALGALLRRHPRVAVAWLSISALVQLALVQWFARWGFVA